MITQKFKTAAVRMRNNPALLRSVARMKPQKTIWGFLGVVLFFIAPEIIAFLWGTEITAYARDQLLLAPAEPIATWYEAMIYLFEEGGSWTNLSIGFAFLAWLFF